MSAQLSSIRALPLAALTLSTTPAQAERRKHLDKAKLSELAESIKSHGLVQPILVRPLRDEMVKGDCYEVVAGERRVIAARQAGLEEIPATVRELTDEQVAELQLIENLQRQDLHELAEAEGYEALQKLGHSVDDMAAKVGKSKGTIYSRMKLLALGKEGRAAFYEGKLSASTALLVARIPAALQKQALGEITKPQGWGEEKTPMSARAAQKHVHDHYMLRLSDAGFKTGDATLVPSAGACGPCPKRTGNQPELFGDVKGADVCTDPGCFRMKIAAHAERVIAAAAQTGQKVLTGAEVKKVAKYGVDGGHLEGYVRLDTRDYHHGDGKGTFRKTLGRDYVPTLLQDPDTGKMIEIAPNKDVDKAHGNNFRSWNDASSRRIDTDRLAAERKHKLEIAYRVALFSAVREASGSRKALTRRELELAADRLLDRLENDSKKRLFAALGWEPKKSKYNTEWSPPTPIEKMGDEDLAQLVRDCSIGHELQVWQYSGDSRPKALEAAAVALDVDAKKIRREIDAAAKAKADARHGKKPTPAKASKKAKGKK
jgi:ParB/RepB/Spo0J family partition protein